MNKSIDFKYFVDKLKSKIYKGGVAILDKTLIEDYYYKMKYKKLKTQKYKNIFYINEIVCVKNLNINDNIIKINKLEILFNNTSIQYKKDHFKIQTKDNLNIKFFIPGDYTQIINQNININISILSKKNILHENKYTKSININEENLLKYVNNDFSELIDIIYDTNNLNIILNQELININNF